MVRRCIASALSISSAIKAKKWLCFLLLLAIGLTSALFVNHKFHTEWKAELTQDAIEQMESLQSYIYMDARLIWMDLAMASVNGGEPYTVNDHEMSLYYYGAVIARVFGIASAWEVFLFLQMAAAGLALLLYPLLIYHCTGSLMASLASPLLLHRLFGDLLYRIKQDTIWAYAWILVIALPLFLLFVRRRWDVKKWLLLLVIGLLVGISNVIRTNSGLPILVLLFLTCIWEGYQALRRKEIKSCISCAAAMLMLFFCNSLCVTWIPMLFFAPFGYQNLNFQPWHSLYIGLGWQPNPYQIECVDACGFETATRIEAVPYYSQRYFEILKAEYFRILRENPGFVFLTYVKKFLVSCKEVASQAFSSHFVALLFSGAALVWSGIRHFSRKPALSLMRRVSPLLWAAFLCVFLGMIPAIIAYPVDYYLYGAMTSCSMLLFCLSLSLVKEGADAICRFVEAS